MRAYAQARKGPSREHMIQSLRYAQLILRLSLAAVFLAFGIDKFVHPQYWLDAWVPAKALAVFAAMHVSGGNIIFLNGIFEVLVGVSMISTIFMRTFSFLAVIFLVTVMVVHGLDEILIRDIGIIGGFLALMLWPDRRYS